MGKTGSGKTYTAKVIVEQLLRESRQVCIIDPTAAWWGLRLAADGKRKGFDIVIVGGDHGDIPLSPHSGAAVANLIATQHASAIVDTHLLGVGEYTRWFTDFAGALFSGVKSPLHLVIDEAHYFMPQQGAKLSPDAAKMLHAANRLMSGGRSRGIRGMMITQRPAKLHKDSLTCADTLIAKRVLAPQDRQAIKDWIDGAGDPTQGKLILDSLASLQKPDAWIWYPEGGILDRVQFPAISTFDSSATPTHGSAKRPEVRKIDLTAIREAMADAVAEAEKNDPKLLRAKIAELEKQLRAKRTEPAAKINTNAIERAAKSLERAAGIFNVSSGAFARLRDESMIRFESISKIRDECAAALKALTSPVSIVIPTAKAKDIAAAFRDVAGNAKRTIAIRDDAEFAIARTDGKIAQVGKGATHLLNVIAQGGEGVRQSQLGVLAGFTPGTIRKYLPSLRAAGFIEGDSRSLRATAAGVAALGGDFKQLPTGDALREFWMNKLPAGEKTILEKLCKYHPHAVTIADIRDATGFTEGTIRKYLPNLAARNLIGRHEGRIAASDSLFDEASE